MSLTDPSEHPWRRPPAPPSLGQWAYELHARLDRTGQPHAAWRDVSPFEQQLWEDDAPRIAAQFQALIEARLPETPLLLARLARASHLVDTLALAPSADLAPLVDLGLLLRQVEMALAPALAPEASREQVAQGTALRDTLLFGKAPEPTP